MASLLNMSGGSLLEKGLPYDAEIEYLDFTSRCYIDTRILPTVNTKSIIKIFIYSTTGTSLFGYYGNENNDYRFFQAGQAWTIYDFKDKRLSYRIATLMNDWKFLEIGNYYIRDVANDVILMSGTPITEFTAASNIYLGDKWSGNNGGKVRCSSVKIYENNVLILDFIPVRVGQVGYMYDKVSKQLFGNAGTGEFILGPDKHKEFVDLGLPSGTLWAEGNIIKNNKGNYSIGKPTDKGCYFSWGNIDGHNKGEEYNFSQDIYNTTPGATLTGNISPTDAEHDAAVARIGEWCHIPTKDQFVELCNSEYTDITGTSRDGVEGLLITSKINGNSIFLPDAGLYNGTSLYANGTYWSSTFSNEATAYYLFFFSGTTSPTNTVYRCWGLTVRPVIS